MAACGKHFPGTRRHEPRLPRRAADRRARSPPARGGRARAVRRAVGRARRDDHDGARAGAGARRRPARDRCRSPSSHELLKEKLGIRGRRLQRRPGDEGRQRDAAACPRPRSRPSRPAATRCSCATRPSKSRSARSKRSSAPANPARSPQKRLDDALAPAAAHQGTILRAYAEQSVPLDVVGCAAHQAVAEEMARGGDAAHQGRTDQVPARPSRQPRRARCARQPVRSGGVRREASRS